MHMIYVGKNLEEGSSRWFYVSRGHTTGIHRPNIVLAFLMRFFWSFRDLFSPSKGSNVQTAVLSMKLVELASLLADRDAKLAALNDFVKSRCFVCPYVIMRCIGRRDSCFRRLARIGKHSAANGIRDRPIILFHFI